jgi:white-opaque regulator 2
LFLDYEHEPLEVLDITDSLPEEFLEKIKRVYSNEFAIFFDKILETEWYTRNGLDIVSSNTSLLEMMVNILRFREIRDAREYIVSTSPSQSLESKAVWNLLASMRGYPHSNHSIPANSYTNGHAVCQSTEQTADIVAVEEATNRLAGNGETSTKGRSTVPMSATDKVQNEAIMRLALLEAALTNKTLPYNPLASLQYTPEELTDDKKDQVSFWNYIADFVVAPADKNLGQTLFEMWALLKEMQNRDIIFSFLICRHYGSRVPGFPEN